MSGRRGEGLRHVEREIVGEKAAALGRAGERLERALHEARDVAERLRAATEPGERDRCAQDYTVARSRALEARLALLIQREALGLRRHLTVDQQFPEPPRIDDLLKGDRSTATAS